MVVSTHDRPARLDALLNSLREQTLPADEFEVVIVDNASKPPTGEVLEAQVKRGGLALRAMRRDDDRGPSAARNEGWRAATAPLIIFTDDDCVVTPRWLEVALQSAEQHPGAFLQGRTLPNPDETDGISPFSHMVVVEKLGPWFETCNIMYPRELLERVDGFDQETFTLGGEDTDLAWRCLDIGVEPSFIPDMLAYHAVLQVGPVKKLKIAARWHVLMGIYARYPEKGRSLLLHGVFWRQSHVDLARFLLALALPKRLWPLSMWLAAPYLSFTTNRRSGPLLLPWFVVHDMTEVVACVRGSIRYKTFVL